MLPLLRPHLHGVLDEPPALVHGQPDVPAAVVHGLRHTAQDEHRRVTLGLFSNVSDIAKIAI